MDDRLYLNDVPLNKFLEYFNESNLESAVNTPVMETLIASKGFEYNDSIVFPTNIKKYLEKTIDDDTDLDSFKTIFKNIFNISDDTFDSPTDNNLSGITDTTVYEIPIFSNITNLINNLNSVEDPGEFKSTTIRAFLNYGWEGSIVYRLGTDNSISLVTELLSTTGEEETDKNAFKLQEVVSTDVIKGYTAWVYKLEDDNSLYLLIKGNKIETPMISKNGENIYRDSNGLLTTKESYSNNFYTHQKAIRRSFYSLTNEVGWMYKIPTNTFALVEKGEDEQLVYHIDYDKTTTYTEVPFDDVDITRDKIKKSFIPKSKINTTTKETIRRPFYLDTISKYPECKGYISSSIADTAYMNKEIYIPDSTAISSNGTSDSDYNTVRMVNLSLYKRYTGFLNDTKCNILIDNNNEIEYYIDIRSYSSWFNFLNGGEICKSTIFGTDENPYILIPIASKNNIAELNGSYITISNSTTRIGIEGRFNINYHNISDSTVSFSQNIGDAPLLEASDLAEVNNDYIEEFIKNYGLSGIYFIKLPLLKIEEEFHSKIICGIRNKIVSNNDNLTEDSRLYKIGEISDLSLKNILLLLIGTLRALFMKTTKDPINIYALRYSAMTNSRSRADSSIYYYKNKYTISKSLRNILNDYKQEFETNVASSSYVCENIYEVDESEVNVTEYYENLYDPLTYIKKTVAYSLHGNGNGNNILETSTNLNDIFRTVTTHNGVGRNTIQYYFKMARCYVVDGIAELRGPAVSENVFYNRRINALETTLKDIFNANLDNFNVNYCNKKANFEENAYNYCKAVDSLIKNNAYTLSPDPGVFDYKPLNKLDDVTYLLIGEKEEYSEPTVTIDDSAILTEKLQKLAPKRGVLLGLLTADKYPLEIMYYNDELIKQQKAAMLDTTNGTTNIDTNVNLVKYRTTTEAPKKEISLDMLSNRVSAVLSLTFKNQSSAEELTIIKKMINGYKLHNNLYTKDTFGHAGIKEKYVVSNINASTDLLMDTLTKLTVPETEGGE